MRMSLTYEVNRRCDVCGEQFRRQRTFKRHVQEGESEGQAYEAVKAQGDAWDPPSLCGKHR